MKKFLIICMTLALLITASSAALAENGGLYLSGKGGLGFIRGDKSLSHNQTSLSGETTKWDSSMASYGASIGWNWIDSGVPIRSELEYYDHGKLKMTHGDDNATFSSKISISTVQFNFFYDFYTNSRFIPYLGAGVGIAQLKEDTGTTNNVCYSLFAGGAYKLTESLLLDMTYRINQFGSAKQFTWEDANNYYKARIKNLYAIEGTLGLRYQF